MHSAKEQSSYLGYFKTHELTNNAELSPMTSVSCVMPFVTVQARLKLQEIPMYANMMLFPSLLKTAFLISIPGKNRRGRMGLAIPPPLRCSASHGVLAIESVEVV